MTMSEYILFVYPDYYPAGGARDRHWFVASAEEAENVLLRVEPDDGQGSYMVNAHLWRPSTDEIVKVWAKIDHETVWADITGMEHDYPWTDARRLTA